MQRCCIADYSVVIWDYIGIFEKHLYEAEIDYDTPKL